ncbi:MAG: hypothetical protein IJI45_19580 [Anaerolineaceae bacterium]|nr:hypothetical protein [Anaerolineaceae bacterium]
MPQFKTIRQVAASGLISEYYLRGLVARGECPGFRSGNRFLVNVELLKEKLNELSRRETGEKIE